LAAALVPGAALGGAWTMPAGQGQAIETLFGWGGSGAPYGGVASPNENKFESQTYVEYGLTDRLTAIGDLVVQRYQLSAPTKDAFFGLDYSGAGLRAKLWSNEAWVVSLEGSAYLSGAHDPTKPAQAGDTGPAADVRALIGRNLTLFGLPAFLDAEGGFRFRTDGPPDEWRADLTLGVNWTARSQIFVQAFNTISNGAGAPGFSAWESHIGQLSVVQKLDDKWSVQVGGFGTMFHRNTNSEYGGLIAVWRRF
jgi:hypothetical protein